MIALGFTGIGYLVMLEVLKQLQVKPPQGWVQVEICNQKLGIDCCFMEALQGMARLSYKHTSPMRHDGAQVIFYASCTFFKKCRKRLKHKRLLAKRTVFGSKFGATDRTRTNARKMGKVAKTGGFPSLDHLIILFYI